MSSAGRPSPARWLMNAEAGCRWSRFESNKLMHPGLPCAAAAWSQLQFRDARPSGRSAGGGDAAKGGGPKALSSALGSSATSAMRASGGRRSHASGGSGREVGGGGLPRALKDIISLHYGGVNERGSLRFLHENPKVPAPLDGFPFSRPVGKTSPRKRNPHAQNEERQKNGALETFS
jgi:hypothetical protein